MTAAEKIQDTILEIHRELMGLRREVNDMRIEARTREDEKFFFLSEKEKWAAWEWACKVVIKVVMWLIFAVLAATAALALWVGIAFVADL